MSSELRVSCRRLRLRVSGTTVGLELGISERASADADRRKILHMTNVRPLDGIVVVSLDHAIAAPLATRHLADLGRLRDQSRAFGYRRLRTRLWSTHPRTFFPIPLDEPFQGELDTGRKTTRSARDLGPTKKILMCLCRTSPQTPPRVSDSERRLSGNAFPS